MKILYVTNMYPSTNDPTYGIFVKEQIEAICNCEKIDYRVYAIDGKKGLWQYIKSINEIHTLLSKEHFDLIHVHYGLSGLFLLLLNPKIPVLMTLHGGDIQAEQGKTVQVALTKSILRKCDYAITLNDRMDKITKRYIQNTEIVPCSVNTALFDEDSNSKNTEKSEVHVLFPSARDRYVKDFPLFQKTCEVLREHYHMNVVEYYLENLSRQEVAELFNKVDVLLMTSISEGSPQVVKEAMACNLPIVSTNVGDVSVLLDDVRNSYVANGRDANELADLVYKSLSASKEGIAPRDKISQLGLDDNSIAQKVLSIYKRLIKKSDERTRHSD